MAVYTVHEPPLRKRQNETDPMRFTFVRDGFHFWAFVLGPLWMLRHRLWLVLIGHLVIVGGLAAGLTWLGASGPGSAAVGVLVALLIGLEASTLRRWTLARRGWNNLGVIVADDVELAERRFFDAWSGQIWAAQNWAAESGPAHEPAPPAPPPTPRAPSPAQPDVIGLFPQPGTQP
jgi:hypothetical protein